MGLLSDSCSEEWAKENYLSANSLGEAKKVREQLAEMLDSRYLVEKSSDGSLNDVVKALLCGFYMRVAVRNNRNGKYIRVNLNDEMVIGSRLRCRIFMNTRVGGKTASP